MKNRPVSVIFISAMEGKLEKGREQGKKQWDSYSWGNMSPFDLLDMLEEEVQELRTAVEQYDIENILYESADVANFAMFVADRCQQLKEKSE